MTDSRNSPSPTQPPSEDDIAAFLQGQTAWRGETPELFRTVLDVKGNDSNLSRRSGIFASLRRPLVAAIAALLLFGVCVTMMAPMFSASRNSARTVSPSLAMGEMQSRVHKEDADRWRNEPGLLVGSASVAPFERSELDGNAGAPPSPPAQDATDRLVIRKATIELLTTDVRAAFAKAQHILRADLGEFAEASTLTGENETAQAQLTLRVAASRLSDVLNELRPLGKVQSENTTGDDVTTQAVDLDARLRNERRVESEVLQLFETRKDAPLKEILDLRDKLSQIRQSIETMQARRETLGRQVSLATVLVIIRTDAKPKPESEPEKQPFFDQLSTKLGAAADSGTRSLMASLAFMVEMLIGGAFWWMLLVISGLIAYRKLRNQPKVDIGPDVRGPIKRETAPAVAGA